MATAKKPAAKKKVGAVKRASKPAAKPEVAQKSSKTGARTSAKAQPRASAPAPAAKKRRADWEAIERDYRTGKFTDQELADKHGNVVSRQAITKMAKKRGWQKDLSTAVRQATKAKLIADEAQKKVAEQVAKGCAATTDTVLVVAEMNKRVILAHREDISRARNLTNNLLTELEVTTTRRDQLHTVLDVVANDAKATATQIGEARLALAEISRLPTRILSAGRLAQAMGRLQQLERTAFGLDEPEQPAPVDEMADLSDEELQQRIEERLARLGRTAKS